MFVAPRRKEDGSLEIEDDSFIKAFAARARAAAEPTEADLRRFDHRRALEDLLPRKGGKFHEFEVSESLGVGAFGVVHRVHDATGAVLALKYLRPDYHDRPMVVDSFWREMDVLRAFHRAHTSGETCPASLPKYHSHGTIHGIPFIVMNYVEGKSLDEFWREGELSFEFVTDVVLQICDALSFCHEREIVHRDVKPLNILVAIAPEGDVRAKLIDFGLASAPESITNVTIDESRAQIGTLGYAPPELVRRESKPPSARSDIFSLGATLCRCLYRSSVFPVGTEAVILDHAQNGNVVLPKRRWGDHGIWRIIQRATRPNPEDRYASVEEFAHDLRQARDAYRRAIAPVPTKVVALSFIIALLIGWFFGHRWA